jgi:secernin
MKARETAAVILSKPSWMWGAEMGANNYGVCIGNEAVWTRLDEDLEDKKLLGMDLVRLGLERGKTAREALNVITTLLEKYGQGGPCSDIMKGLTYHNSFLIVDKSEAWVLETAGQLWAAEKVKSGFRNISNSLSIGCKIDLMSEGLKEKASELGLWKNRSSGDEFNFAKVFSSGAPTERYFAGKCLLKKYSKDQDFDLMAMMNILRDQESEINMGGYDKGKSDRYGRFLGTSSRYTLYISICITY